LSQNYSTIYLEWVRSAQEAFKRRDYESAARFLKYVTIYYGTINDVSNQRKYAIKTGDCYLQAAKEIERENSPLETILLCIKAAYFFREGGREESAQFCDSLIQKYCSSMGKGKSIKDKGEAHDLKTVGDYFVKNNDCQRAIECYQIAAEKASGEEKLSLCGGLYRDMGDCYQNLKDFEKAAMNYAKAADMYLQCQEYFEAASHYCESCFLFIYVGKLGEASIMARKAGSACEEGHIPVLLNDLSYVCRMLCEGSLHEAKQRWDRIKIKFKKSYTHLIDSCFRSLREKWVEQT